MFSLQSECCWQPMIECRRNSSWRLVIRSTAFMCPCCDSRACIIQPPTHLCTCHLLLCPPSILTSEEAGCPPTCPAVCDQLALVCSLSVDAVIDSWHKFHTACLITRPPRGEDTSTLCTLSAQCAPSLLCAVLDSVLACSPTEEHYQCLPLWCSSYYLTCALAGAWQPLWLLWQTETGVAPWIDPSSHRGVVAPLLCALASYSVCASGQNKLAKNHREIKFGIRLYQKYHGRERNVCINTYC